MTPNGLAVAVSPDGARIAYQFSDFITVHTRVTGAKAKFTLPDNHTALAGKGAWTPDGRSLTVVGYQVDATTMRSTGVPRCTSDRPRPGHPPYVLSPAGLEAVVAAGLVVVAFVAPRRQRWRGLRAAATDRPIWTSENLGCQKR